jgi:hypothetical protein
VISGENADNGLTLPAQRHLVRMVVGSPPRAVDLLALQLGTAGNGGLRFLRSDDEGASFQDYAAIQPDGTHTDRADLVPVGDDLALIYSYENISFAGSGIHDVYFQWWRHVPGSYDWAPEPPVLVFDSTSDATGYFRAELARDSSGKLWVQSFRLNEDGGWSAALATSSDGGSSWTNLPSLDELSSWGGGRLAHLGSQLILLYNAESIGPARFRLHRDGDPDDAWSPVAVAFPDGIYHGAALSTVTDGGGGLHVVYKNQAMELRYRFFDGTRFGDSVLLDGDGDWSLQPALTTIDDTLYLFSVHPVALYTQSRLELRRRDANGWSGPEILDGSELFMGYPAAIERLPQSAPWVPCAYGRGAYSADPGDAVIAFSPR